MLILPQSSAAGISIHDGGWNYRQNISLTRADKSEVALTLTYYSRSTWQSEIGFGWCGPWSGQISKWDKQQYRLRICGLELLFSQVASPTGSETVWQSPRGDQLRVGLNHKTIFLKNGIRLQFDSQDRLSQRQSADEVETFAHDALGRVKLWQKKAATIVFNYQGLSPLVKSLRVNTGSTLSLYHAGNNLIALKTGQGLIRYSYDDYNNLLKIEPTDQLDTNIEYDSESDRVRRVRFNQCDEVIAYENDQLGRLKRLTRKSQCLGLLPSKIEYLYLYQPQSRGLAQIAINYLHQPERPIEVLSFNSTGQLIKAAPRPELIAAPAGDL